MSDELLNKMAHRAGGDPSLFAGLIDAYGRSHGLGWDEIAAQLGADRAQLARLALCYRPRPSREAEDLAQVAGYTGLAQEVLRQLIREGEATRAIPSEKAARVPDPTITQTGDKIMLRFTWKWAAVAAGLLLVLAMIVAQPERTAATLVVTGGQATLQQSKNVLLGIAIPVETVAPAGDVVTVRAGDTITLDNGAVAELRLLDGSTIELLDGAVVDVADLQISDSRYRVQVRVLAGGIYNRVQRLLEADDAFDVTTPSSTASVRGTAFAVEVLGPEATYYAGDEGVVAIRMGDQEVEMHAGEEVTAVLGQPLEVRSQDDRVPPNLFITSPSEPPIAGSTVTISGQTEPGATVTVDGQPVPVGEDGSFEVQVVAGAAAIEVVAADQAGNTISVQIETR